MAGIANRFVEHLYRRWWDGITTREGISGETRLAGTQRYMIHDMAKGIAATSAWTRIDTLVLHTCLVETTFRGERAFGSTAWRLAHIFGHTGADGLSVEFLAL